MKHRRLGMLTIFGLGYVPFSASLASLLAVALYIAIRLANNSIWIPYAALLLVAIATAAASVLSGAYTATDPHEAVIDEFLAMFACAVLAGTTNIAILLVLFVVFRVLDNVKPYPLSWMDANIHGPLGYLVDDLAICIPLGIVACVLLRVL